MYESEFTFDSIRNKIRASVYLSRLNSPTNQIKAEQALNALLNDYRRIFHVPIDIEKTNRNPSSTSFSPQIATAVLGLNTTVFYPIRHQKNYQHVHLPTNVKLTNRKIKSHKFANKKSKK